MSRSRRSSRRLNSPWSYHTVLENSPLHQLQEVQAVLCVTVVISSLMLSQGLGSGSTDCRFPAHEAHGPHPLLNGISAPASLSIVLSREAFLQIRDSVSVNTRQSGNFTAYLPEDLLLLVCIRRKIEQQQVEERGENSGFISITEENERSRVVLLPFVRNG